MNKLIIDIDAAIKLYESGKTFGQVAAQLGCSKAFIYQKLKAVNINVRPKTNVCIADKSVDFYKSGMSVNAISKQLGVSRRTVDFALRKRGITTRNQSESEKHKWSQMSAEQRQKQVAKAHETVRNLPREFFKQGSIKQAIAKEKSLAKVGFLEKEFFDLLGDFGFLVKQQVAFGPYNIDLAVGNTAIEIHINSANPHSHAYYRKRVVSLLKGGWHVIYVKISSKIFIDRAANQVARLINISQGNESLVRQYWMVRGSGELVATGCLNGDDLACVAALDGPNTALVAE